MRKLNRGFAFVSLVVVGCGGSHTDFSGASDAGSGGAAGTAGGSGGATTAGSGGSAGTPGTGGEAGGDAAPDTVGDSEAGPLAASCQEIKLHQPAAPNGIYVIAPGGSSFSAFCEMTMDGGGWTAFFAATNGSPNVFNHFEVVAVDCTDPQKHCLRRTPASIDTTHDFAASCGGAMAKFQINSATLGFFRDGVQSAWQNLQGLTSIQAANLAYVTRIWTGMGLNSNPGWIISGPTDPAGTFGNSYSPNAIWDYCNGAADTTSLVRLYYR